jgi:1-phosphatidylinositol phosphodiesterase
MASLDGGTGIWELTVPGTHNSAARRGGPRARTQTMGIGAQLEVGIRFFDIRLRHGAGVFRLYHGRVDQRLEFEAGVVDPMAAFLERHPGEAVVVCVRQEDRGNEGRFAGDFEALAGRRAPGFYTAPEPPRLAQARGRIVLVRRFAGSAIGIPAAGWRNDATFRMPTPGGVLCVEDEWELAGPLPGQMAAKWSAVARHLDEAAATTTGWYLTFTSATSDFSFPRAVAGGTPGVDGMNRRLLDYLGRRPAGERLGTVVMDFPELPDGRLIQGLIDANRP